MDDLRETIYGSITAETAKLIEKNETMQTLPAEVLASFLHWMIHRDVFVTIGRGRGADALAKPVAEFLKANGLPPATTRRSRLKSPGRVRA